LPHAPEANVSGAGAPAKPQKSREFFEIRGFFFGRAGFLAAKPLFFAAVPRKRLRSVGETASYGSNSAVDSPGAAMGAFTGKDG